MPHAQTKTVYYFDELSDEAKEKARAWYRDGGFDYEWWDLSYDQFDDIAECFGIDFHRKNPNYVNLKNQRKMMDRSPEICFSGFYSQGDGLSFCADYAYQKGWRKHLEEHFGKGNVPKDLVEIGENLQEVQRRYFYGLEATVSQGPSNYVHEMTMTADATNQYGENANDEAEEGILDAMRLFAQWMYYNLETEWEWMNSDEAVDESIRACEYEFDEFGYIA